VQTLGDSGGQRSVACCSPWVKKTQTGLSNWIRTTINVNNKRKLISTLWEGISLTLLCWVEILEHFWVSFLSLCSFLYINCAVYTFAFPSLVIQMSYIASCVLLFTHCCCFSVAQPCLTLCKPMDCSIPGLSVPHCLLKLAQVQFHCIGDAIQTSHPPKPSSPSALNLSQHQGLFQWVSCSQMSKILKFQLQHQSFQWVYRVNFP